jgi:plastocyanin
MTSRYRLALVALAAAILLPATAQAATKTVVAGPLKNARGAFGGHATGDVDGFSLKTVTIHVGDKVRWKFNGFHTVTFPKKHGRDIPFVIPDPSGAKYAGINDAAGNPFWFNGQGRLILNPLGAFPQGGKSYNGSKVTGSGLPPQGPAKPYTLKFTKAGTYTYECVIHPGMTAKVRVVPKGKRIPSARQDRRTAAKLFAKEVREAKKLAKGPKLPKSTVQAGNDKSPVVQLRFFPGTIHVPVGGSVRFQVKSRPEIHTFSFGPANYLQNVSNAFVTPSPNPAGPPTLVFSGQVAFPSDTPPAPPPYDGTNHGNGFFSTGILDGDPRSPQPSATTVKFSTAGTYNFICLIHPFMHGTVVVGP